MGIIAIDKSLLMPGVYAIKCKQNNRYYIGSSQNIYYRMQQHNGLLKRGLHFNRSIQKDYNADCDFSVIILVRFENNENQAIRETIEHLYMIELLTYGYNLYNLDSVPPGKNATDYFYKKGVCKFKKDYDIFHNCYEFNYFQSKNRD